VAQARFKGEDARVDLDGPPLAAIMSRSPAEPFELTATFASATATVAGKANLADWSVEGEVTFATPQLAQLLRPLGAPFKDFGPLQAGAHVSATRSGITVQLHDALLIPVQARGEATLQWSGPRPSLTARIDTTALDAIALRDWLATAIDPARLRPGRLRRLIVVGLRASEGRITIGIGQLGAGSIGLADVVLESTWAQGQTDGSVKALMGASPVTGTVSADLRNDAFTFAASANAKPLVLPAGLGVAGTLGAVEAKLDGGGTLEILRVTSLRAVVDVRGARLDVPTGKGRISRLNLDRVLAKWSERDALSIAAIGVVSGQAVKVNVKGTDATALWQQRPWALRVAGEAGPLRVQAKGSLALMAGHIDADLDVTARAKRLTPFAPGDAAWARLPLEATGRIALRKRSWRVDLRRMVLGNSRGRLDANGSLPITSQPIRAEGVFDMLDLTELVVLGSGTARDRDLLPQHLTLPAADLSVHASRVMLPGSALQNANVTATMRDGKLTHSAFGFELDRARVEGTFAADLTGAAAKLSATAQADGITERHFGIQRSTGGVRLELGEVTASASSTGNRLRDLAANADADIGLQRAAFSVAGGDGKTTRSGTVATARFSAKARQPTRLTLEAELAGFPIELDADSAPLADLLPPADVPFRVDGRVAGIDVGVAGIVPAKRSAGGRLAVSLRGKSLDQFKDLLAYRLPSVGPFRMALDLHSLGSDRPSADVDVDVEVGESRIKGTVTKRLVDGRTRWEAELSSPLMRLEDLGSAEWIGDQPKTAPSVKPGKALDAKDPETWRRRAQAIRDEIRAAVRRFDAHVRVAIDSVRSGGEDFGHANADVLLESGRLRAAPFAFDGPRGALTLSANVDYSAEDTPFELDLDLRRFDYGRLIRSIKPASDVKGELSAKLTLAGRGKVGEIRSTLQGRLGLMVFPGSTFGTRLLELWGGGMLRNLGQGLDPESRTPLNCGVATFDISGGALKSRAFMLDSTRIRAAGELAVDLNSGALKGVVTPKPKRAEVFSSRLPVAISGTLAKPVVTPATGGVAVTVARYFYFVYAYLYDAVTGERLAADGRPDCIAAYEALAK
jgi:hypothetical protein